MSGDRNFKVVLLGEGCVGKTSLVCRYCSNQFNEQHRTTIQASFLEKRLNVEGVRVTLSIWDTAGQERFHALGPIYYRDANGALLVYDITDHDSFVKAQTWVKELRKMLGNNIKIVIAGNKVDLERDRAVSIEEAETYAATVGATHYSTSAKLNRGIDEVFLGLTKAMLTTAAGSESTGSRATGRGGRGKRGGLVIPDERNASSATSPRGSNGGGGGGGCCGGGS